MSATKQEPGLTQPLEETPNFRARRVRQTRPRDLAIRFAAGALTSVAAGVVTLLFGPRIGGVFLAFPAILAASLTLIEQQEDVADAREDARGAIVGGFALGLFALIATLTFMHLAGAVVLLIATAVWILGALAIYAALWWRGG